MKRCIVVCADDFGLTKGVNEGIVHCYSNGILRSTSLLANGPELNHAIELANKHPGIDLGIHLSLNDFPPICPEYVEALLTDGRTFPSRYFRVIKKVTMNPVACRLIEGEFRCQIEKILELGVIPSHINSHKHIHLYPPMWNMVKLLALEYKIPYVRYPIESLENLMCRKFNHKSGQQVGSLLFWVVFFLIFNLWHRSKRSRSMRVVNSPDYFCGMYTTGFLDETIVSGFIESTRPGMTELMCHPGYFDDDLRKMPTRLLRSREKEIGVLCSESVKQAIIDNNVEVTSFYECAQVFDRYTDL